MKKFISQSTLLQAYGGINIFCLLITVISKVFFQISFGIFTLLAGVIPIIGIIVLLMIRDQKGKKAYYLFGSLSSCVSLLLISQNIFRATASYRFGVWSEFYFLLTTFVIVGIIYFTLFDETLGFIRKISFGRYLILWAGIMFVCMLFYNWILSSFFPHNSWVFFSYSLWVITITVTMITCFNLKNVVFKR